MGAINVRIYFCVLTSGPMTISTQRGTGCGGNQIKSNQKVLFKVGTFYNNTT
jgi:hypothetical protein